MDSRAQLSHVSWTHTLGILRGAAEGNDAKYNHTLGGYDRHVRPLVDAGLVAWLADGEEPENDSFVRTTEAGQAFYEEYLTGLPAHTVCRSNAWVDIPEIDRATTALAAEYEQRVQGGDV
ncbi:hypothetical protein OG413_45010 [Streptomyces sp. NBC_01433]|uniref:hypothetical protein n=1 Tax=Streptomyces sp. NBC_01433 TaxID=2903864 RepID=UPI00225A0910|nr:hypothetical protein [Streptomyces sp. NBC_01433]MCX4682347.1 hypothetical protein [Streptomyces sp. NBC_01433]